MLLTLWDATKRRSLFKSLEKTKVKNTMKHLLRTIFLLCLSTNIQAGITGDDDCVAALQDFDASHNKTAKIIRQINESRSMEEKLAVMGSHIRNLEKVIDSGDESLSLCSITGKEKRQISDIHNNAKFMLKAYKAEGFDI